MLQGMLNNAARGGANVNTMGRGGGRGGRQRQRGGVGVGGSGGGNGGGNGAGGGKKKTVQQGMEANVQRTIYICDIDQQVTEEQLASVFADCGSVIDCRVCGDPNSAMRFAFIEFTTKESAAKVCRGVSRRRSVASRGAMYYSRLHTNMVYICIHINTGNQQDRYRAGTIPFARAAIQNCHCACE